MATKQPAVFGVRTNHTSEVNKPECEAWNLFIRWCSHVPIGSKVELLCGDKIVASLNLQPAARLLTEG